jgi:hypothetical protein
MGVFKIFGRACVFWLTSWRILVVWLGSTLLLTGFYSLVADTCVVQKPFLFIAGRIGYVLISLGISLLTMAIYADRHAAFSEDLNRSVRTLWVLWWVPLAYVGLELMYLGIMGLDCSPRNDLSLLPAIALGVAALAMFFISSWVLPYVLMGKRRDFSNEGFFAYLAIAGQRLMMLFIILSIFMGALYGLVLVGVRFIVRTLPFLTAWCSQCNSPRLIDFLDAGWAIAAMQLSALLKISLYRRTVSAKKEG